jgi:outer membrane protein assembly factor BamD
MKFRTRYLLAGLLAFSLGSSSADAFLDKIRKRGGEKRVLNAEQLTTQEGAAAARLKKAQSYQAGGKRRQARDTYKSVATSYPRTDAGSEALFEYAKILEAEGEGRKAFEQYQKLLTNYRNTPNFNEAVQRQFGIADGLRTSEKKGFLGLGVAIQPSKLIEMFTQISESAPYTDFAPKSLLNIGYVHTKQGATQEALASFKTVVDTYQNTEFATEAQYEIFRLRGVKAERSNSPVEDRAQVEAGLDFVNQNPDDQRSEHVQSNLHNIEERSMEKLFTTGQFYENSGKPDSARVYYREVVKNPNTPWAAKAQARLNVLDNAPQSVEKRAGFFGPNPIKKDKVEMRTSDDEVVPLPAEVSSS